MRTRVILAAVLACALPAFAQTWIADSMSVHKLDPSSRFITASATAPGTKALVVDPRDHGAWVLSDTRVSKFDAAGARVVDVSLSALGLSYAALLAIDGRDGSVWVGSVFASEVVHLDSTGKPLGGFTLAQEHSAIAVAMDQTLWLLGDVVLEHRARNGELLGRVNLGARSSERARHIAVDSIGSWVWVSDGAKVSRISAQTKVLPGQPSLTSGRIAALAGNELQGSLWVLADGALLRTERVDTAARTVDLRGRGIENPHALAFDPTARSLLVVHDKGLARLDENGATFSAVATPAPVRIIAAAPMTLDTVVSLRSPQPGSTTRDRTQPIRLGLQALCSGRDCDFSGEIFAGTAIDATVNGERTQIPAGSVDAATGGVTVELGKALAEGRNTVRATAEDVFGNPSGQLSATFFIDSTAPRFTTLKPASGLAWMLRPRALPGA